MLSLSKRYAVYIPTTPRPSSKIFEFFGISPSASPTSSLRRLLSRQGTGARSTPCDAAPPDTIDGRVAGDGADHARAPEKGWSHTEAFTVHEEPMGRRCRRCFMEFVRNFGAIWFLIPINAGLIGLLFRQILVHILIPSDLVHATHNTNPFVPSTPSNSQSSNSNSNTSTTPPATHDGSIQIKGPLLHTTRQFHGQKALQTISNVFFFVDLVLFTVFSCLFLLRLIWFRRTAWREVLGLGLGTAEKPAHSSPPYCLPIVDEKHHRPHPKNHHHSERRRRDSNPVGDLSLWPLAWLTLVAFVVAVIPEREGSEPLSRNLTYAAYITWWIGATWTILTTMLIYGTAILASTSRAPSGTPSELVLPRTSTSTTPQHNWSWRISPNLLFPPVALSTLAVIGSLLVSDLLIPSPSPLNAQDPNTGPGSPSRLSGSGVLPVLTLSFSTLGASLFLSAILFPALIFTQIFSSTSRTVPGRDHHHHHIQKDVAGAERGQGHGQGHAGLDLRGYGLPRTGTDSPVQIIHNGRVLSTTNLNLEAAVVPHPPPAPQVPANHHLTATVIPTIFYFLATVSQSSAAIQLLGSTFSAIPVGIQSSSTSGGSGIAFLTDTAPSMVSIPCTLFALLLLGISGLWFLLGLVCVVYHVIISIPKELLRRWDMAAGHGIVLSLATMGLSAVLLGAELDSGFFRVVACVFLGVVIVGFVVNLGFTVWFVATGRFRSCYPGNDAGN